MFRSAKSDENVIDTADFATRIFSESNMFAPEKMIRNELEREMKIA